MKNVSIKQLDGIAILDTDGKRIAVKYYKDKLLIKTEEKISGTNSHKETNECDSYDLKKIEDQKLFESEITDKVKRLGFTSKETEVLILNKYIVLYLCINDVNIYVVGDEYDNEIILNEIIQTVYQSLNNITNNQIEKKILIEKLDSVYLILDEIADSGIILETNPNVIINRLYMQEGELHEHTVLNQAISSAKENIIRSLLSGT